MTSSTTYFKSHYTSPFGLFVAREEKTREGHYHIYRKHGTTPLFSFNSENNRFVYIGGIAEISPEGMGDLADLGKGLFEKDND